MFKAKQIFSFFHHSVTAHAIITKLIGLVYLFDKMILISKKNIVHNSLWHFGSNSAPKNSPNCLLPLYWNHVLRLPSFFKLVSSCWSDVPWLYATVSGVVLSYCLHQTAGYSVHLLWPPYLLLGHHHSGLYTLPCLLATMPIIRPPH